MDLGTKVKKSDLYPTMAGEDKERVRYPHVCLPFKLFGKGVSKGDEVEVVLKGKVTAVVQSEYADEVTLELTEGETKSEEKKEEKTLLG